MEKYEELKIYKKKGRRNKLSKLILEIEKMDKGYRLQTVEGGEVGLVFRPYDDLSLIERVSQSIKRWKILEENFSRKKVGGEIN